MGNAGLLPYTWFGAQQPVKDITPLPAPVPVSIATAKKVCLFQTRRENSLPASLGGPTRPYNEFYLAMKSWGGAMSSPGPR